MKSDGEIEAELERLLLQHYYSEEFELQAAVTAWRMDCDPEEQAGLDRIFHRRFLSDPSLVHISLARCFSGADLEALLVEQLNFQSDGGQKARMLLVALRPYRSPQAAEAVERFLDSSLEMEALHALAEVDWSCATKHLPRLLRKDGMVETCLHVLHEHRKRVGWAMFLADVRPLAGPDPAWMAQRFASMFAIKTPDKIPFTPAEQKEILNALYPNGNA